MLKCLLQTTILVWLSLGSFSVFANLGHQHSTDQFMPENNLHKEDHLQSNEMTQEKFVEIIDHAIKFYQPIIETFGAQLKFNKLWTNNTVNASAQQTGNRWVVNMYGGLARRNEVTPDGFALVVCHELGHHLGGLPFYPGWAASEGQSDYFATLACPKLIWKDQIEENKKFRESILSVPQGAIAKKKCDDTYTTEENQNLCYRTVAGGYSLAHLLSALGRSGAPNFNTPDPSEVNRTSLRHPKAQCRLDTYVAGALCKAEWNHDYIPGKKYEDRKSLLAFIDAKPFSCHRFEDPNGARPRCWFSPDDITRPPLSIEKTSAVAELGKDDVLTLDPISVSKNETVNIKMTGTGDADLYVDINREPTEDQYKCRPYKYGSKESCSLKIEQQKADVYAKAIGWSDENIINISVGINAQAKLCRNFGGGMGDAFECWDEYSCRLISGADSTNQLNWCIDY